MNNKKDKDNAFKEIKPLSDKECIELGKFYGETLIKATAHMMEYIEKMGGDPTIYNINGLEDYNDWVPTSRTYLFAHELLKDANNLIEHVGLWERAIERELNSNIDQAITEFFTDFLVQNPKKNKGERNQ